MVGKKGVLTGDEWRRAVTLTHVSLASSAGQANCDAIMGPPFWPA